MGVNKFKAIRAQLGVTQAVIAEGLGVTQGNVSFYEKGQTIPPEVAGRLIAFAAQHGVVLSYDDIYGTVAAPTRKRRAA